MLSDAEKNKILSVSKKEIKEARDKRIERVEKAISYKKGSSQKNKLRYLLWESNKYMVVVDKPGKEAAKNYNMCKYKDGSKGNNPNDMYPTIIFDGEEINDGLKSFSEVFEVLFSLRKHDKALELIACLLFRSAFMVDHKKEKDGLWKYNPPQKIVNEISKDVKNLKGIPILTFLHYLDAIGLNEDVKYYTLGYDIRNGTGRRNNMMTCVSLIAVILERYSIAKFAGYFARPPVGISAISQKKAVELFPYLL